MTATVIDGHVIPRERVELVFALLGLPDTARGLELYRGDADRPGSVEVGYGAGGPFYSRHAVTDWDTRDDVWRWAAVGFDLRHVDPARREELFALLRAAVAVYVDRHPEPPPF